MSQEIQSAHPTRVNDMEQTQGVPADVLQMLKDAHDESLNDEHRSCRSILREAIELLSAAPQAQPVREPLTDEQPAAAVPDEREAFEAWYVQHHGSRSRWLLDKVTDGPFAGDYRDGATQGAWNVWQASAQLAARPAQPVREPLFYLHCGQIDSSGEQDEWCAEANGQQRVDDFCRQRPGQTVKLYPHVQPVRKPMSPEDERALFEACFSKPSALTWNGRGYDCKDGWENSYAVSSFCAQWLAWQVRAGIGSKGGATCVCCNKPFGQGALSLR